MAKKFFYKTAATVLQRVYRTETSPISLRQTRPGLSVGRRSAPHGCLPAIKPLAVTSATLSVTVSARSPVWHVQPILHCVCTAFITHTIPIMLQVQVALLLGKLSKADSVRLCTLGLFHFQPAAAFSTISLQPQQLD